MLLFQKRFHEGLVRGTVTLTLRRWATPHVKVGGRYRCHPIGVLAVDAVERVQLRDVGEPEAQRSGFASRAEMLAYLRTAGGPLRPATWLWAVTLRHGGDGDRVAIALEDQLGEQDVAAISQRLARLDGRRPWTRETLAIIGRHPRVAASQLAKKLRRETLPFKIDVRKLKKLGLTQSFEVGYEISPRGRAYLARASGKRVRGTRPRSSLTDR